MSRWYVVIADVEEGPMSSERLKVLASAGLVEPDTKIRSESQSEWSSAKNVKGLAFSNGHKDLVPPAPPTAPITSLPAAPAKPAPPQTETASNQAISNPRPWTPILLGCVVLAQIFMIYILCRKPRFDYRLESPSDGPFESQMNGFGDDGWDLASARRATSSGGGSASYEVILKRVK